MRVDELTRKELIKGLDQRSKRNSKLVSTPKYVGITSDYTVVFDVPSATTPGVNYKVCINLTELPSLKDDPTLSEEDLIRLCIDGDIKLSCTCPAAKYWGYDYILSQLWSKDGDPQTIYPEVRNPRLDGTLCKHEYIAVRYLGKLWKKLAYDIRNSNYITV